MMFCAAMRWRLLAILAVMAITTACGNNGGDDDGTGTTTRSRPTPTTMSADEAAVRKVAEEWNREAIRLAVTPDPDDPALERYLTGALLRQFKTVQIQRLKDGLTSRASPENRAAARIISVEVDGNQAELQECIIDDRLLVRRATGEVLDDSVSTSRLRTVLSRDGGSWKLARSEEVARWEGVAGCAKTS